MIKKIIIPMIVILFMSIGYAAVSNTLYLEGKGIVTQTDINVRFSRVQLNEEELQVISDDGMSFSYTSIDNCIILEYEIVNESFQYDAEVTLNCASDNEEVILTNSFSDQLLKARTSRWGTIKIDKGKGTHLCSLEIKAHEREEVASDELVAEAKEKTDFKCRVCTYSDGYTWTYAYTNTSQTFKTPCDGNYKLEVWGAQGGSYNSSVIGGYGAYAVGDISLTKGTPLYIYVGGAGSGNGNHVYQAGGFNGGGNASPDADSNTRQASGGGATHISLRNALLRNLASYKSDILIVAAGGGGGGNNAATSYLGVPGSAGGGIAGNTVSGNLAYGGTQTSPGYAMSCSDANYCGTAGFGIGASCVYSGGGGGLYGGGCRASSAGGSSYIGNPLLKNKVMVCYQCMTSNDASTKTVSTGNVSANAIVNTAKLGDGYARITYLSE